MQERLRILLGLESSGPGGAENMVVGLASGLVDMGHEAMIVTDSPGWMTERAEAQGLPVWIDTQAPGVDLRWIVRLARRMRRERIHVFHSHEFSMNVFGGVAAWLARVPHVVTIHGRHYVADAPRRIGAYRLLHRFGVPIVAVSDDLRGYLAKGFGLGADALKLIHNGISLPEAPALDATQRAAYRLEARRALPLPSNGPLAICVGNLYSVKGHDMLIRALPQLPNLQVAIAGRGDQETNLRMLAGELRVRERLHLLGLRDDVADILAAADVFVHPSRSEGLPLAVLEAMGHGLPVVASRVGGIPEAIEDGRSGILVASEDPAALADALSKLLDAPEQAVSLAHEARARAEAEFSIDAMLNRYVALYSTTRKPGMV